MSSRSYATAERCGSFATLRRHDAVLVGALGLRPLLELDDDHAGAVELIPVALLGELPQRGG